MAEGLSAAAHELGATDVTAPAFPTPRGHKRAENGFGDRAGCGWVYWRRGSLAVLVGGAIADRPSPWGNGKEPGTQPAPAPPKAEHSGPAGGADRCRLRDPRCCWCSRRAGSRRTARDCPATGDPVWSIYQSAVQAPTAMPGPTDEVYPGDIEHQVRACAELNTKKTTRMPRGRSRGNLEGPGELPDETATVQRKYEKPCA